MSEYFPKPKSLEGKMKVAPDLSNYATKIDLKNATGVGTSNLAKKVDLTILTYEVDKSDIDELEKAKNSLNSLKDQVDKLDIDNLVPVFVDFSKLRQVVKNKVVKKTECNELVLKNQHY